MGRFTLGAVAVGILAILFSGCSANPQAASEDVWGRASPNNSPPSSSDAEGDGNRRITSYSPVPERHRVRWYYDTIFHAPQEETNWCWAACFEMVLRSSGLTVSQSQIVQAVKGRIVNDTITTREILATLGQGALKISAIDGPPLVDTLRDFLARGSNEYRHFLIEWRTTGPFTRHLVMITGIEEWSDGSSYVRVYDPYNDQESWFNAAEERDRWVETDYLTFDTNEALMRLVIAALLNAK